MAVSNSYVYPCGNSFVSEVGWRCPALWLSPIHVFPRVASYLFPSLAGVVRLPGCLKLICLLLFKFVCFLIWLVESGCLVVSNSYVCPSGSSFVSQSGWRCPAVWLCPIHVSSMWQFNCLPVWLVVPGCLAVSSSLFPMVAIHLSLSLAGGVRLFGCLQSFPLPVWQLTCFPMWLVLPGFPGVFQLICFPLWQFICLVVWLVVSGSLAVSNSVVCSFGSLFVS